MAGAMTKNQITRFTKVCEDQGAQVTRTKKGLLIRFPDGTSAMQHFTPSDVRAEKNQIARFRRSGMVHPNDSRQMDSLPDYITGGSITPKTREKIIKYVIDKGIPESILASSVVKDLDADPTWVNRALYHTGFRPGPTKNRRVGRPWYTPEEILDMKNDDRPEVTIDLEEQEPNYEVIDVGPVEVGDPVPLSNWTKGVEFEELKPAPEPESDDIDFIDERDSWVPEDMKALLGPALFTMFEDRMSTLRAVGLSYELRVWKA